MIKYAKKKKKETVIANYFQFFYKLNPFFIKLNKQLIRTCTASILKSPVDEKCTFSISFQKGKSFFRINLAYSFLNKIKRCGSLTGKFSFAHPIHRIVVPLVCLLFRSEFRMWTRWTIG